MARVDTLSNFLTDVANAIRNKKGTTEQILASNFDTEIATIETGGPNLQNKSITITENGTTNITADEGFDGLNNVSVITNVPSSGDVPEKYVSFTFDEDGYPITGTTIGIDILPQYAFTNNAPLLHSRMATIDVSSCTQIYGHAFDNNRTVKKIIFRGNNEIQTNVIYGYLFYCCTSLSDINLWPGPTKIGCYAFNKCTSLVNLILPDTITTIGEGLIGPGSTTTATGYTFYGCTNLILTSLPNSLTTLTGSQNFSNCPQLALTSLPTNLRGILPVGTFMNCPNIKIKTVPDGINTIQSSAFYQCTSLSQISMKNVTIINGSNTSNGAFFKCASLKSVWIGSAITSTGFGRYAFYNCSSLIKMFIDLPRETVETFTNYQYAFMNDTTKINIIICNDDEGFMTKEEFDAIDWSTYTG